MKSHSHRARRAAALRLPPAVQWHSATAPGDVYTTYYGTHGWSASLFCLNFATAEDAAVSLAEFRAHVAAFRPAQPAPAPERVSRTDGASRVGGKHHGCHYFVLDIDHDKFAAVALAAYADACEAEYPLLALDLRAKPYDLGSKIESGEPVRPILPASARGRKAKRRG